MIGRLTGQVVECKPDHIMVDVAGVGYYLHIPLSTYYHLCEAPQSTATLQVHTHVREDALNLYGFLTREEKETFEILIGISGIGPRVALAFLSGIGVDELHQAIHDQDRARLQKIPGVGKKTAERVLLELKDRVGAGRGAKDSPEGPGGAEDLTTARDQRVEVHEDAISALVNLGYTREAARRAVDNARTAHAGEVKLESLLKTALGRLAGG
jgi:Holliday junction DNA helicase RuvA